MATYDSYKDSGVKWLGQIPSHWEIKKCRAFFDEVTEQNMHRQSSNQLQFKYGTIVQKPEQVIDEDIWKTISKYTVVNPGDIIINGLNLNYDLISQRIGIVKEVGVITSAYVSIRPKNLASAKFYEYLLKALDARKTFHGFGTGVRATLSWKELKHKLLPLVPLKEQEAIVAYLDKVTGEIDRAIEAQQKMIDALNERKQIIITRAVTRGLNPEAPLRDSGIDWLGQIPAHWETRKLKTLCTEIKDGTHFSPSIVSEGLPYITATDVRGFGINYNTVKRISNTDFIKLQRTGCEIFKGDVLLVKDGATTGRVGMKTDDTPCVTLSSVAMLRPRKQTSTRYLYYLLASSFMQEQISSSMAGAALPRITLIKLMNFSAILPPIEEQNIIVDYIESQISPFNVLVNDCERMIALLTERKQIIINEVVTGKKKVI